MTGGTGQQSVPEKSSKKEAVRLLGVASTVGINFVVSTFIGLAIGYGLDRLFGTSPYLTVIFLILGIIAGFKYFFKIALRAGKDKDSSGQEVEDSSEKK